jgi:hypothetical protein
MTLMSSLRAAVCALLVFFAASERPVPASAAADRQEPGGETFVGTTPATAELLQFLGAAGANAALIEWTLSLQGHGSTARYTVSATIGLTQPNMPGISREKRHVDAGGRWSTAKGTRSNATADVIVLGNLSFVRLGPSIIHPLNQDRSLMTGNGGWSFSLNRSDRLEPFVDPTLAMQQPSVSYTISPVSTGPSVYGVFEGRTPCQGVARAMGLTVDPSCVKVKWRVTLYQDPEARTPSTYKVEGSLYRDARSEGRWTIARGQPGALPVIRLESSATFVQADDDVLLFADRQGDPLVGNASFSYTLDRRTRR